MNDKDRHWRVEKAQMKVLFKVPFFAPGVARLPVRLVDPAVCDTAATDGKDIIWNRDWFDKLSDPELVTVLCHEVCHCMLGHGWRAPVGCDWEQWNIATDHAVNLMLKDFSAQVMAKRLADPFPFPPPADSYCADPQYSGMAEEAIYAKLPKRPPGGKPGNKSGKGSQAPGSMPSFGQILKPAPGTTSAQQKALANDWQDTLQQAVSMSKGRGDCPGSMDRFVDQLLHPQVPWWELLRQWLREQAADDWNWQKPNPYFSDSDFILPSLDSERMGPIVFATDTSGSIDQDCLARFQTEKQNCLDDMKPSRLVDLCCDTKIQQVKEYRLGDTIDRNAPGGGGTDFRPVFEHIEAMDEAPKCLVYLTDLDGVFPDKAPGCPVLWICWCDASAPFGEVIRIK